MNIPAVQQALALETDTAKTCPICGALARQFGRNPGDIWVCTQSGCQIEFRSLVEPRPRGGKPRG
jgi:ribosomal protein L37AE/L43A